MKPPCPLRPLLRPLTLGVGWTLPFPTFPEGWAWPKPSCLSQSSIWAGAVLGKCVAEGKNTFKNHYLSNSLISPSPAAARPPLYVQNNSLKGHPYPVLYSHSLFSLLSLGKGCSDHLFASPKFKCNSPISSVLCKTTPHPHFSVFLMVIPALNDFFSL